MGERGFVPPVRRVADGWTLDLHDDERELLVRLMGELHDMLSGEDAGERLQPLFPVAYPEDDEKEAEYQRLMRDELVASRLAAIDLVRDAVATDGPGVMNEDQTMAFMQSINAVRLVLGSMLEIDDDEDDELNDTPEHQLYTFLSWVLEWTVRALSPYA